MPQMREKVALYLTFYNRAIWAC